MAVTVPAALFIPRTST